MPTTPPNPVPAPKDKAEKLARKEAVKFITGFCNRLWDYAYATRSHMPADLDYTDFSNGLRAVIKFCKARPDWTLELFKKIRTKQ